MMMHFIFTNQLTEAKIMFLKDHILWKKHFFMAFQHKYVSPGVGCETPKV